MNRGTTFVAAVAAVLVCCHRGYGWGGNHPQGKIGKVHADWPDGLLDLVNSDGRVHGHWVNANDEFFFQGDAAALERFLKRYGELEGTPLVVILHAGSVRRSALWGEKPRIAYDWKLLIQRRGWGAPVAPERPKEDPGYVVTVDAWLDGGVDLGKLEVPVQVQVKSGGEIEKFIAEHEARRKEAKDEQ